MNYNVKNLPQLALIEFLDFYFPMYYNKYSHCPWFINIYGLIILLKYQLAYSV